MKRESTSNEVKPGSWLLYWETTKPELVDIDGVGKHHPRKRKALYRHYTVREAVMWGDRWAGPSGSTEAWPAKYKCSDAALRPLTFSFFLSFLGIYILWTRAQCLLDTCGL